MKAAKNLIITTSVAICTVLIASFLLVGVCKIKPIKITSASMEPTLPRGSVQVVFCKQNYAPGDIVMFKYNGLNIVHRVVLIFNHDNKEFYVCKGDSVRLKPNNTNWQDDAKFLKELNFDNILNLKDVQIVEKFEILGRVENDNFLAKFLKNAIKFRIFLVFLLIFCLFCLKFVDAKLKQSRH